jgi:CheY-like chemotaxis protein
LTLESRPGLSAVFRVELPCQTPRDEDAKPAAPRGAAIRGRRVLIVDDESDVADVLGEILEADDHQVATSRNGAEALRRLETDTFDAILSDLRMPVLDGPDFYHEVARRYPALRERFIFLTGDTLDARISAFLAGRDAPIINKPFALEDVRAAIQRLFER